MSTFAPAQVLSDLSCNFFRKRAIAFSVDLRYVGRTVSQVNLSRFKTKSRTNFSCHCMSKLIWCPTSNARLSACSGDRHSIAVCRVGFAKSRWETMLSGITAQIRKKQLLTSRPDCYLPVATTMLRFVTSWFVQSNLASTIDVTWS